MKKRIALGILALGILAGLIFYGFQCVRRGNDFWTLHSAAQQALWGGDIYAVGPIGTPWRAGPPFIFLISPLGLLPVAAAAHLWFYLKIGLTLLTLKLSMNLTMEKKDPRRLLGAGLAFLFSLPWLNADFTLGHMNLPVVALTMAALSLYQKNCQNLSAFLLALAIASKVSPALLIFLFLARGDFSYILKTFAMLFGICLLPTLFWGKMNIQFIRHFAETLSARAIFMDPANGPVDNFSLPSLWLRMTGMLGSETNYGASLQIFSFSQEASFQTAYGLIFALIALLFIYVFLKRKASAPAFSQEAALFIAAIPLLSWVTRRAHLVWLIFPFMVLVQFCLRRDVSQKRRRWTIALLSLAVLLQTLVQTDFWGKALAYHFLSYYVLVYSYIAMMAALLLLHETFPAKRGIDR